MESDVKVDYVKQFSDSTDRHAILEDLMTAYGNDVWNYAFSITRKWDQADDITQEVFIKVFKNLCSFRHEASIKTWILTITRNMTLDYRRSAFYRKVILLEFLAPSIESTSAEQAVNEIWKQVLGLPVKYREVLILYAHYQLSMKEMAHILGVTEGTVKSRLFHARKKMARLKEAQPYGTNG